MGYVTRPEYCRSIGQVADPSTDMLCNRAWQLFQACHVVGVTDLRDMIVIGVSQNLNAGNLRTEYTGWCKGNAHMLARAYV